LSAVVASNDAISADTLVVAVPYLNSRVVLVAYAAEL